MVQELNSLTYSNIFNNRVSFISTHISDPDVNELRRYSSPHAARGSKTFPDTGRKTSQLKSTSSLFFKPSKSKGFLERSRACGWKHVIGNDKGLTTKTTRYRSESWLNDATCFSCKKREWRKRQTRWRYFARNCIANSRSTKPNSEKQMQASKRSITLRGNVRNNCRLKSTSGATASLASRNRSRKS